MAGKITKHKEKAPGFKQGLMVQSKLRIQSKLPAYTYKLVGLTVVCLCIIGVLLSVKLHKIERKVWDAVGVPTNWTEDVLAQENRIVLYYTNCDNLNSDWVGSLNGSSKGQADDLIQLDLRTMEYA